MSEHYFWLGRDAEPPEADETAQYEIEDGPLGRVALKLIEADGFVTLHPKLTN